MLILHLDHQDGPAAVDLPEVFQEGLKSGHLALDDGGIIVDVIDVRKVVGALSRLDHRPLDGKTTKETL
ncbi:MAG: hypothetical protein EHM61_25670 [Acidobacteria bacterium]|nr:MAG: hypothetical protein EHM61_25670 [Acidobacteriota bacterium]